MDTESQFLHKVTQKQALFENHPRKWSRRDRVTRTLRRKRLVLDDGGLGLEVLLAHVLHWDDVPVRGRERNVAIFAVFSRLFSGDFSG